MYLTMDVIRTLHANPLGPWVFLRCDQLIPVNQVVNKKEQLETGLEEEEEEKKSNLIRYLWPCKFTILANQVCIFPMLTL
jgi:hypothetical protein